MGATALCLVWGGGQGARGVCPWEGSRGIACMPACALLCLLVVAFRATLGRALRSLASLIGLPWLSIGWVLLERSTLVLLIVPLCWSTSWVGPAPSLWVWCDLMVLGSLLAIWLTVPLAYVDCLLSCDLFPIWFVVLPCPSSHPWWAPS